ncbi:MAG: hypothetical protein HY361_00590 [Candidatus Aenigmarchaeota archaeon]|nr:hypothetical protein [Candidatus Aenigmarchaeota archaeon]
MAEKVFLVNKSFDADFSRYGNDTPRPNNLRRIPTSYGEVVAFEMHPPKPHGLPCTVVPGFYRGDLPSTEDGLQQMKVETIRPGRDREVIAEILKNQGYIGHINFW